MNINILGNLFVKTSTENSLPFFGGIRDAAPDAWWRRVIEAKLKVAANSLPESSYLLDAGSDCVGALDVRPRPDSAPKESALNNAGEPVLARL